MNEYRQAPV
jgi:hypothetical protein